MSILYKIGDCVKDIFRVESILEGGMGVVYICRLLNEAELPDQARLKSEKAAETPVPETDSRWYTAFKTFHRELLWHTAVEDDFKRECLTWITLLPHPNIVAAKTTDLIGAYLHLWLEYVDGGSLRDRITRGAVPLEEALSIAMQVCLGMEFLFQSGPIIHRDIKPENILLTKSGVAKVTDFGLAKALSQHPDPAPQSEDGEEPAPRRGVIAGTVPYMSPEQFTDSELDVRSDIYGFGVVFYEMLTGRRPFHAVGFEDYKRLHEEATPVSPKETVALPDCIDRIVLKCLEKRPEERWSTFTELRLSLESFCLKDGLERLIVAAPSLSSLEQNMTAETWNGRGYALAKLAKYEESAECYRKSLELDPEAIGANINMGSGLKRIGRGDEALHYFEREVELHPGLAIAYEPLANHYMEIGREEDALVAMRKSAELDAEGIARWRTLGFICLRLKRDEESRKVWDHVKSLLLTVPRFRNPMSVNNEVIISMNMGAIDVAMEMHAFGVEYYPDSALIWYNLGVTLHRLDRVIEAIDCYSRALELDSSLSFAVLNRALLLLQTGDWEHAKQDLQAAVASDPESMTSRFAKTLLDTAELFGASALGMLGDLQASLKYIM